MEIETILVFGGVFHYYNMLTKINTSKQYLNQELSDEVRQYYLIQANSKPGGESMLSRLKSTTEAVLKSRICGTKKN